MNKFVHGGDIYRHQNVIDYSSNCNPFGVPDGVVKAICKSASEVNHYPDILCARLRTALASHLGTREDYLFFGNGAAEVIFAIAHGLKPAKALIPAPTFAEYEQALTSVGCQCNHYMMKDFLIGNDIIDVLSDDLDILFICNPNNPTGLLVDGALLEKIVSRCNDLEIVVVLDECFLDFVNGGKTLSLIGRLEEYSNLVILKAFTKLYAMAGVRLGYCISANKPLIGELEKVVQPWNVSVLAQEAGVAALTETEYVAKSLAMIEKERRWLISALRLLGYEVLDSCSNYVFFKGPDHLYEEALAAGIMVRDCSNYVGLSRGYYRVAVRLHEDNVKMIEVFKDIRW